MVKVLKLIFSFLERFIVQICFDELQLFTISALITASISLIFNRFDSLSTAIHILLTELLTKALKANTTALLNIILPVDKKNRFLFVIKVGKSVNLW